MKKPKVFAIILAGGVGSRMTADVTKQQIEIMGKSVLGRSIEAFSSADTIDEIIVVTRRDETVFVKAEINKSASKPCKIVFGGNTRAESAANGFKESLGADYIAIHDAARCLITPEMINKVVETALEFGAATAVCDMTDTVKRVENGFITETLPRDRIVRAQTPQVFKASDYDRALAESIFVTKDMTDDNMLMEKIGVKVKCVSIGSENLKVTTDCDLLIAESILKMRGEYV